MMLGEKVDKVLSYLGKLSVYICDLDIYGSEHLQEIVRFNRLWTSDCYTKGWWQPHIAGIHACDGWGRLFEGIKVGHHDRSLWNCSASDSEHRVCGMKVACQDVYYIIIFSLAVQFREKQNCFWFTYNTLGQPSLQIHPAVGSVGVYETPNITLSGIWPYSIPPYRALTPYQYFITRLSTPVKRWERCTLCLKIVNHMEH